MLRLLPFMPFFFTLACGPETMPRPKLDRSSRTTSAESAPAATSSPATEAAEAAPTASEEPAVAPPPAPEPAGPTIAELCEDNFDSTISGLGADAGLVLFVASEYDTSKNQTEQFKRFITASNYTGLQYFKVEVNSCAKLMMSQQLSRVPAISIYQDGTLLGSASMLNNVLISDAEVEDLIALMR